MNMKSLAFYRAAHEAIVRYIREVALLPAFPSAQSAFRSVGSETDGDAQRIVGPVLRVLATNEIEGQVLPRTEDVWFGIRAFSGITKTTSPAQATALLAQRMAVIALLVRLSASSHFEWSPMMDCGGVRPPGDVMDPNINKTFWLKLLRDLSAGSHHGMTMECNLVALSRSLSPRFLLCVDSDTSQVDFGDLLDQFLWATRTDNGEESDQTAFDYVLQACDLAQGPLSARTIEIGLSFTHGKITHTMIAKLFDVLNRLASTERRDDGIHFRLTTLRVGPKCSIQPKALETIRERWGPEYELTNLSLGSMDEIKPSVLQDGLVRLTTEPTSKLRRLVTVAHESFPALASVFRTSSANSILDVDVNYDPTEDNAAWLAFAFFHVDSHSSATSICLRFSSFRRDFTTQWIETFERALQSFNPCGDLVGEENDHEEATERTFVTIKASTPVKSHAYTGAKRLCKIPSLANGTDQAFERLTQVKNYVGVVIPGIGGGWVPEASIVDTRFKPSNLQTNRTIQHNRQVKSLAIVPTTYVSHNHVTATLRLLDMIGEPLECLSLPLCHFDTTQLAHILRCCPNLRELNISGHQLDHIDPLVDAYLAGECNIHTLSLAYRAGWSTYDIPERLAAFLRQHHQKRLPLARLAIELIINQDSFVTGSRCTMAAATNLASALSDLSSITFVHFTTGKYGGRATELLPIDFSRGLASEPFVLDRKLAFLSVVRHKSEDHNVHSDSSVWTRLDTLVLSRIFSFSAKAIARHALRFHGVEES